MPIGDLPGWHQVFNDDFTENVPVGEFPGAVSSKWSDYTDGTGTTYHTGGYYYPSKVVSIGNGIMNMYLHTENGMHMTAAPIPMIPAANGRGTRENSMTYGRYSVRFRVVGASSLRNYKTAWLLWPNSNNWPDGEIDFPEGDLAGTMNGYSHEIGNPQTTDHFTPSTTYASWHTATLEWTAKSITFYLDGKVIGKETRAAYIPTVPMHLVLQTETDQSAPSNSTSGNLQIDWVAIWTQT